MSSGLIFGPGGEDVTMDALTDAVDDFPEDADDEQERIDRAATYLATLTHSAVQHASNSTSRSAQQQDFRLGMSDLGHCREYARRMIVQEPFTDERDKTAAFVGTVLGDAIERAIVAVDPDAGWVTQDETVTTLPNGVQVLGHVDLYSPFVPSLGGALVVDLKSKDGTLVVRKQGSTQQQHFQKHGYALGLVQEGKVEAEGLLVANVYYDRSGKEPVPYVVVEPYDPQVGDQIAMWLDDVFYAVTHQEEASRDMPRDWCERWCEHFTGCRLFDTDVSGLIEAPDTLAAVDLYTEGLALEKQGAAMKEQARDTLQTVQGGSTRTHLVRWTEIGSSEVPGFTRKAYRKLDVRPIPKGKKK